MSSLVKIASIQVPGNPGVFYAEQFIKSGMPGFSEVGDKFTTALHGDNVSHIREKIVEFWLSHGPIEDTLPPELLKRKWPEFNAWTPYQFLVWPSYDLLAAIGSGSQLGCMLNINGKERPVRIKVDWSKGHKIGLRPSERNWTWKPGTIFAIEKND